VAGKQKGKRDDRYLWPEMLRVIREIKPTWVLGENVPGILRIAGKTVCEDLEREGYAVTVFNFEAAAVGAKHRRERIFVVANSAGLQRNTRPKEQGILREVQDYKREYGNSNRPSQTRDGAMADTQSGQNDRRGSGHVDEAAKRRQGQYAAAFVGGQDVADTTCELWEWDRRTWNGRSESPNGSRRAVESGLGMLADGLSCWLDGYWRVEPNIPRVATGVKNRVDRLRCLGNAVVPQQVYPILKAIAEIETREPEESEVK
jgi:DNA (cytosine-5)-methyltransferase 1